MAIIAQNHLQFIIEISLLIYMMAIFILNLVPISLSGVLLVSLIFNIALFVLFGIDASFLFLNFGQNEFSHPLGSIAVLTIITSLSALALMKNEGIKISKLKTFVYILLLGITVFGGLVHRSFLILWVVGLFSGFFIMSKSFRGKIKITLKQILVSAIAIIASFGILELLSNILNMPVLSPMLRISRIESNATSALKLVINNTHFFGHIAETSYWGVLGLGFADGYISLPISFVTGLGLPFPVFYGVLVNQKDVLDYMVPGIFSWAYDFGYFTLIVLLFWSIIIMIFGFRILAIYRRQREVGIHSNLGKEALLTGSLAAFITQTWSGLFVMSRNMNGLALVTLIILSALIFAHTVSINKEKMK